MKEITINQIIQEINSFLMLNSKKTFIRRWDTTYDFENGKTIVRPSDIIQKINSMSDFAKKIRLYVEKGIYINTCFLSNNVENSEFCLKLKRERLEPIYYGSKNIMSVVSVELLTPEVGEMTFEQLEKIIGTKSEKKKTEQKNRIEEQKKIYEDELQEKLSEYGITNEQFEHLAFLKNQIKKMIYY